jgi:hypothetical protein
MMVSDGAKASAALSAIEKAMAAVQARAPFPGPGQVIG